MSNGAYIKTLYDCLVRYIESVPVGCYQAWFRLKKDRMSDNVADPAPLRLVLSIPRDEIEAVCRYATNCGEIPKCITPPKITFALYSALSREEVSDDEK